MFCKSVTEIKDHAKNFPNAPRTYSYAANPDNSNIHYSLFFGSLFSIHYKKGHYSLIIIPHPDPH